MIGALRPVSILSFALHLKLGHLARKLGHRVFEFLFARAGRGSCSGRGGSLFFELRAKTGRARLKLGYANRGHRGGRKALNHSQFLGPESPVIEHAYESDRAGHATQRIKRERIVARPGSASLMPKKLVPEVRSVIEVRDSAARYQRRAED